MNGDKDPAHLAEATVEPEQAGAVGLREDEYYARLMGWRFRVRQMLMRNLEREMPVLQRIQKAWRTPFRDEYFVKTSLLGTHTFFMVFLPLWYWFSVREIGHGLLYVLAAGNYATSALKDALSVPRPLSPPVVRLSVGTHALEYGFPSTHSSNAVSMAFFFSESLLTRNTGAWAWLNPVGILAAAFFAWSVAFGRLYTGMHSMADVFTGSSIGIILWAVHFRYADALNTLGSGSGWVGSITATLGLLLILSTHPEPAEPCPCFEDTVAFLSVVLGVMLGSAWAPDRLPTTTYGYQSRTVQEFGLWVGATLIKLVGGISAILVWRIIAKQVCHAILPPIFRFFAPLIQLPRRGYEPATHYDKYPPEAKLDPVPSILDLPSLVDDSAVSPSSVSSASLLPSSSNSLRSRAATAAAPPAQVPLSKPDVKTVAHLERAADLPEHKDADVLTKVVVYAGIGWIATIGLPWLFERVGLSVWR
ncbi:hypothetical protein JCM8097_004283 [Rhodosporidiobolus ruineniae]